MTAFAIALMFAQSGPLLAPVYETDMAVAGGPDRVCATVEVQHRSGHSNRRVCFTEAEWRRRLGNDWRSVLSGRSLDDDLDALDLRTRNNPRLPERVR